jgi:hypothetical protein
MTFAAAFFGHDLGRCNSSVNGKLFSQLLVVDGVVQVLHIQVHPLVTRIHKKQRQQGPLKSTVQYCLVNYHLVKLLRYVGNLI